MKQLLLDTIKEAGALSLKYFRKEYTTSRKGSQDIVTEADTAIETFIRKKLEPTGYNILGEEEGFAQADSNYTWYIDPIDGTRNFNRGIALYSITIALAKQGEIIMGAIYDPVADELFFAEKGKGATLNGQKIYVRHAEPHETIFTCSASYAKQLRKDLFLLTRVLGSAAIELAYVDCGRSQGCALRNLKPWDFAAGALLIKEAGGNVTDIHGDSFNLDDDTILATTKELHPVLFDYLNKKTRNKD